MLDRLFPREKAAYERGRKKGYKEGYADHEEHSLSVVECPNSYCTKYRTEWREAEAIGYDHALRDLELSLDGTHDARTAPVGQMCRCDICKTIGKYKGKLMNDLERTMRQYFSS